MQTVKNKLCIFNMCPRTSCRFLSLCFIGSYFKNPDKVGKCKGIYLNQRPPRAQTIRTQFQLLSGCQEFTNRSPHSWKGVFLSIFLGQSSVDLAFL